jgi:molybdopterin synthase sulfur carrier subunit
MTVDASNAATAADVWRIATEDHEFPSNTLIAINMEYANAEQAVNDGDEVAFFPPVTGG